MSWAEVLHNLSYGSEMLAYLVTIFLYHRRKSVVPAVLLCLMSMIFVTETLGKFKSFFPAYGNIFLIQNIEMLVEIFLFLLVYIFSLKTRLLQRIVICLLGVYCLIAPITIVLWQSLTQVFPTYALVVGGLFVLVAIQLYFYEGISNMHQQRFDRNYLFYISIGLFVFYANEMPVMTLLNHYLQNNAKVDKIAFVFDLKLIVSIFFYSLYSFGILWTTRK